MTDERLGDKWIARHKRIKAEANQRIQLNQSQNKPRKGVKKARRNQQQAKEEVELAKQDYRLAKQSPTEHLAVSKEKLEKAREEHSVTKKVHKAAIKRNGGTKKAKLARKGYQTTRSTAESAVRDNDTLGDIAASRQKIRHNQATLKQSKKVAKYSYSVGKNTVGGVYHLGNRGYNLARGRGFTRTLKDDRWETKVANRLKQMRRRLASSKVGKTAKGTSKTVKTVFKPAGIILKNPLSLKAYLTMFVIVLILALFSGSNPPTAMEQDEFELNQSWLYLSKIDREKSTDKVDYWTNIDDVVFYMNYKYGDYQLGDSWTPINQPATGISKTYKDALASIWNHLNSDTDNLKEMSDLYGKKSQVAWMILTKEEREEYTELLSESKDLGRYIIYQELDNPFYTEADEANYNTPISIIKRYGYTSKDKIYQGSQLKASTGQTLRAVFSGTLSIKGNDVTIKTSDAIFTYKHVGGIRYKDGDQVALGDEIGVVKTSNYQEIYYQKLEEKATKSKAAKWTYVNPGFYFQKVDYAQTTSVMTDLDLSGDLAQRAKAIYNYIKKVEPKATDNGIAAMLGNFATESNITAKRAEGDYLNPPVGASSSSWDDPNWLNMGNSEIYGGRYPNIIHRGIGLGQWTDTDDGSTRHTLLIDYAKRKNKKWYDLELQLDFMLNGDSPYYITILKGILTSNEDVNTLTKRFLNNWEGNPGDKLAQRQDSAKQMLVYFKQQVKGSGVTASSWNFPSSYEGKLKYGKPSTAAMTTQAGNHYPVGQCTWYVYNRLVETGILTDVSGSYSFLGNGQNWVQSLVAKGWKYSSKPVVGAVCSTAGGFDYTYAAYGHVMFVEAVNDDGTFLISECNYNEVKDKVHYRVVSNQTYYTFAIKN